MLDTKVIDSIQDAEATEAVLDGMRDALQSNGVTFAPERFKLHDLERMLTYRRRMRGQMDTAGSRDFAAYVKANKEEGCAVFVHPDEMLALAVLNMGTPAKPGHADNLARLTMQRTAEYAAMLGIAHGLPISQTQAAEFIEDWSDYITCLDDGVEIPNRVALASIRKLTIESARKVESTEKALGASLSTFESVQAVADAPIPTVLRFDLKPYEGIQMRAFHVRLGVTTSGEKPSITLRIVNLERHKMEMAAEFAALVGESLKDGKIAVHIGTYKPA